MIFGKDLENGNGIEWIFVKETDGCDLYITNEVILCSRWDDTNLERRPFPNTLTGKLLNEDFYLAAFSPEEKEQMVEHPTLGCKLFVPTFEEIECLPNKKAKIKSSIKSKVNYATRAGYTPWFLRDSSTFCNTNWTCIDETGDFDSEGSDFKLGGTLGIRPCMLLKKG